MSGYHRRSTDPEHSEQLGMSNDGNIAFMTKANRSAGWMRIPTESPHDSNRIVETDVKQKLLPLANAVGSDSLHKPEHIENLCSSRLLTLNIDLSVLVHNL